MSTSISTQSIERITPDGRGLMVSCQWHQDRFQHNLVYIAEGQNRVLMSSCEGAPDDRWPACPPLQQLLRQTVQDDPALLGVGMAGTSHWSASFVLRYERSIQLFVDLACAVAAGDRSAAMSPQLQTTYNCHAPVRLQPAADGSAIAVVSVSGGTELMLSSVQHDGQSAATRFRVDGNRLVVQPATSQPTGTTQWNYRLALAGPLTPVRSEVSS